MCPKFSVREEMTKSGITIEKNQPDLGGMSCAPTCTTIQTEFTYAVWVPPLVTVGKINLTYNHGGQTEVLEIILIMGNCIMAWTTN